MIRRSILWYGFEFDYENADPDVPLVCVWTRSRPGREGDAAGVRSEGLPTGTTEVALEGESTYKSEPAFQASFRLIYSSAFR